MFVFSSLFNSLKNTAARLRQTYGYGRMAGTAFGFVAGAIVAVSLARTGESAAEPPALELQTASLITPAEGTAVQTLTLPVPKFKPVVVMAKPAPRDIEKTVAIRSGDTLMNVLVRAGLQRGESHNAIKALSKLYSPRRLRPGQELSLNIRSAMASDTADEKPATQLTALTLHPSVEEALEVRRDKAGKFVAKRIIHPLRAKQHRAAGTITESLFLTAKRTNLPTPVLLQLVQLFSFDVDFQRDIQSGDTFEVLFESNYTEDGALARHGDILFARLTLSGTEVPLYRFAMRNGEIDYFNVKGESVRKALMKTPVDGARLSSRYGRRKHPILGYNKIHRGIDFAARRGTPVMAAGDGKVEYAGRNGAYGKYIRIRHNSDYKTAYAHLKGYARGIQGGKRVKQGQIIGYVGSTGRSTGPHLHYEILRNGRQINPLGLKLPSGEKLRGKQLAKFKQRRDKLDIAFLNAPTIAARVASSTTD